MLEPIYRIEFFLDAIVNNTTPPEPIYRAEFYLAKIAGSDVEIPEPVYRMEKYLAYLCGEEVELPDPIYRIEYYLAFLCGLNVELPEPIYRVEFWLWDWCGGGGIEKTVTGNPIHILDALAKPAQALSVKLEPIQDLHGYDNPWPSGGGKNKLPPRTIAELQALNTNGTWSGNTYTHNGVSFACSVEDGYVNALTLSGTATAFARFDFYKREDFTQFSGMIMNWYPQYISGVSITIQGANSPWTTYVASQGTDRTIDTIDNPVCNMFVSVQANTVISSPLTMKPMIRLSSVSDATFAPYSNICPISGRTSVNVIVSPTLNPLDGTITNIPLGGTCYGGQLDVLTGVLTVTWAIADLGTLDWVNDLANGRAYTTSLASVIKQSAGNMNLMSSALYPVSTYELMVANVGTMWESGNGNVSVNALNYSTIEEFKTAMSGVQLCYELATPITIQLTPTQVELLQGENNLFSDGEMTLVYLADGNASDVEALNILLGNRYVNNHGEDEPTDREALDILLGGNTR